MRKNLFFFLLLWILPLYAQSDSIVRSRLGEETLIDIPLKNSEKIALKSFYNKQPVWIRLIRDSTLAQVAIIGVQDTAVSLDQFIAIYPERRTHIQLDIFSTLSDSDVGIETQRLKWQHTWRPLSYRTVFFTTLLLWIGGFLGFIFWRIRRYYQQHRQRYTRTEIEASTLFEQVSRLLEQLETQPSLPPADAATLYVLILSCWNARYNWGGHQRLIQLYPCIAQNPTLNALHIELESYLFSDGKKINTQALLESCRPTTQGEKK